MNIQVETFEEIGLDVGADGSVYNDAESAEALQLIESLGLEGQKSLHRRATEPDQDGVKLNPYRQMTMEEMRVYRMVLPDTSTITEYNAGPIPLRVLQIAAHAMSFDMEVEVWHPKPGHPDPLLVGVLNRRNTRVATQTFILARWGSVLVPFEELRTKAVARAREILAAKVAQARQMLDSFNPDAAVALHFAGKPENFPWIHLSVEG